MRGLWAVEECGLPTTEAVAPLAGVVQCSGLKSEPETCRVK